MDKGQKITISARTIKGAKFMAVRNYTNSAGELSNQTFLVGANYETAKQADIETARAFDLEGFESQLDEAILAEAKEKIIASLEKPSKAISEGQKNAYDYIAPGLKKHTETGDLYLSGFAVAKTVIEKGTYKHVNSRPLTIAKKELTKAMNLKTSKFRTFKLGNAEEIALQNIVID